MANITIRSVIVKGFAGEEEEGESVFTMTESGEITRTGRRRSSVSKLTCESTEESTVLVIYSGGTIGMQSNPEGELVPASNTFGSYIRKLPFLHDEEYAKIRFGESTEENRNKEFVLPEVQGRKRRVLYTLLEYDPLLDSSNMTMDEWICLAEDIKKQYENFDGFVILHGTDTLAYTASALSFMLENLGKTVILTGAQLPIFQPRSDAKDNLLESIIIAGNYVIPEVSILFGRKLFRGNRTVKMDAEGLNAFDSPGYSPLAKLNVDIEVMYRELFKPAYISKFTVHSKLNPNVGLLRIFPSITTQTVRAFFQPPIQGVVLQSYGTGNIPSNRPELQEEIKSAIDRGVIVLNCLQCLRGTVSGTYETGKFLLDLGVIPGADMTPEAALTKLSYVLSKDEWDTERKKEMLRQNLRGELTPEIPDSDRNNPNRVAGISAEKCLEMNPFCVNTVLLPALLSSAVLASDTQKIDTLIALGADLSQPNVDQRTALHVACAEGKLEMVQYMLQKGASVHTKDRYNRTPLNEAVLNDHHKVIELLVNVGAHFRLSPKQLGSNLCKAASRGDIKRLQSYKLAGANLFQTDHSGRTALHVAALHGHVECIKFLLKENVQEDLQDIIGLTPRDYALKVGAESISQLL